MQSKYALVDCLPEMTSVVDSTASTSAAPQSAPPSTLVEEMYTGMGLRRFVLGPRGAALLEELTILDDGKLKPAPVAGSTDERYITDVTWDLLTVLHFFRCKTVGMTFCEVHWLWRRCLSLCTPREYLEVLLTEKYIVSKTGQTPEEVLRVYDRLQAIASDHREHVADLHLWLP